MTEMTTEIITGTELEQEQLGEKLAGHCRQGLVIHLLGELGAGKTTLARGFVHGLGYHGRVKSPTYTLVETYPFDGFSCFHFDLYRLADPEELEYMGIRDFQTDGDILLIEWPDKGRGFLPQADLVIQISYLKNGRRIEMTGQTAKGEGFLREFQG